MLAIHEQLWLDNAYVGRFCCRNVREGDFQSFSCPGDTGELVSGSEPIERETQGRNHGQAAMMRQQLRQLLPTMNQLLTCLLYIFGWVTFWYSYTSMFCATCAQ